MSPVKPDAAAVEHLLHLARRECGATLAFAALSARTGEVHTYSVPAPDEEGPLTREALGELVREASVDPELPRARVLVRTVDAGAPLTLAVAPALGVDWGDRASAPGADDGTLGGSDAMIGLVCEAGEALDDRQTDLLLQFAQRLGRHAWALHHVEALRRGRAAEAGPGTGAGTAARDRARVVPGSPHHTAPHHTAPRPADVDPSVPQSTTDAAGPWSVRSRPQRAPASLVPPHAGPRWARGDSVPTPTGVARVQDRGEREADVWWLARDPLTGLPSVAQFFTRVGRLLVQEAPRTSKLALVLVEVPEERTAPAAARALASELRYSDPLARIDRALFAAALLLVPGGARGDAVEARLGRAVRASLDWLSAVQMTHVVAVPGDHCDVDELVRRAIAQLPGKAGAAEPPGGGRGAPLLGSPSPMVTS